MLRVTRNIIYNGIGQGLSLLLSFVAVRFVFRRLGGDALGLIYFNLSVSMAMMMGLDLGISKTIVREVASQGPQNSHYVRNLIGTATAFYWSSYVILVASAYFLAPVFVKHWVHLQTMSPATAVAVLRVLAFGTLIPLPRGLYDSLLLGLERMGHTNILRLSITATQQAGIFVVLVLHGDLFAVAYWIVFSAFAGLAAYYWMCGRAFSFGSLWPLFDGSVIRKNWVFSLQVLTMTVTAWFIAESDKFVVSRMLPLSVMGFYAICKGAVARCSIFTMAINEATYPHMARLHSTVGEEAFRAEYTRRQDLVCLGSVPLFAAIPFVAHPLFTFLFNARVAESLLLPVTILALGGYMQATITIPNVAALAAGRPDIGAKLNTLGALAVLPCLILFTYLWGLTGAGLGLAVYTAIAYVYAIPQIARTCLKTSTAGWFAHVGKVLALALSTYGLAWGLLYGEGKAAETWLLLLSYLAATAAFLLLGYLSIGRQLGGSILGLLRGAFARSSSPADPLIQDTQP